MNKTGISYLDYTWNPTHGCSPVSEGCRLCWAARMAKRLAGMGVPGYDKADPFAVTFHEDRLDEPLRKRKPSRIGVSFMGDLFHESVPFEWVDRVFGVMALQRPHTRMARHTWMILTKRPGRMPRYIASLDTPEGHLRFVDAPRYGHGARHGAAMRIRRGEVWPNVQLGMSASNQGDLDKGIGYLMQLAAAGWATFLSLEPLLGPVDLAKAGAIIPSTAHFGGASDSPGKVEAVFDSALGGAIVGCESGPGRRETKIEWVRDIRDQCQAAGVPLFLKQLDIGGKVVKIPLLDGRTHDELPREVTI